jgi:hypothetical protein
MTYYPLTNIPKGRFIEFMTWHIMIFIIRRWTTNYMTQFDMYKLKSKFGSVYIHLSKKCVNDTAYIDINGDCGG